VCDQGRVQESNVERRRCSPSFLLPPIFFLSFLSLLFSLLFSAAIIGTPFKRKSGDIMYTKFLDWQIAVGEFIGIFMG